MTDTIVDEVRSARDAHAAKFNYDLDAIFRDIKEQERRSGRQFVSFPPRQPKPNPLLPAGVASAVPESSKSPEVIPAADL